MLRVPLKWHFRILFHGGNAILKVTSSAHPRPLWRTFIHICDFVCMIGCLDKMWGQPFFDTREKKGYNKRMGTNILFCIQKR